MKNDDDIDRETQELIAADKALTQEQRNEVWRADKIRMYRRQLRQQLEYLDKSVPSLLCALNARNAYDTAFALWEDDMFRVNDDREREHRRKATGRCVKCGDALPLPYEDGQDFCPVCDKDIDETIAKYEG